MNQSTHDKLPSYLRKYCTTQDYSKYTSRDHAAWRYIMRQSRSFFNRHGVPIYLEGLIKTAIPVDRIPKVSEMDLALQEFGWGAVAVSGFIPPTAFLDLQARGILPIATDMRTLEHVGYTPAPDIVHEAAGHAPIIADRDYRDYLRRYANVAELAIMSSEDLALYEAIRKLSDVKENPDKTLGDIALAQEGLNTAIAQMSYVSEATKVARMAWWTVEYGLVGPVAEPKIYGAGLLSSIGESQTCLSAKVAKIPLSVDCINTTYDITEPQPQLFVAEDMHQLSHVLDDLAGQLSYTKGGVGGLQEAMRARTVNTVELDSGIQISGLLVGVETPTAKTVDFIKFSGPSQISKNRRELDNQGTRRHSHGFSTPLGRWKVYPDRSPAKLNQSDLDQVGISKSKRCRIEFLNGFVVEGVVQQIVFTDHMASYMTWSDCTVKRGSQVYFEPSWGPFDMPLAERVTSVFGGPSDRSAYGDFEMGGISTQPGRQSPYSKPELNLFEQYNTVRAIREHQADRKATTILLDSILSEKKPDWLLVLECFELCRQGFIDKSTEQKYENLLSKKLDDLKVNATRVADQKNLIERGLNLASQSDH